MKWLPEAIFLIGTEAAESAYIPRRKSMEDAQKRKLVAQCYPQRPEVAGRGTAKDANVSPGRHAEAVREHLKLRKGQ